MRLFLYTDGGSRGNPGPAAIGGVGYDVTGIEDYYDSPTKVPHDREIFTFSELIGVGTNNQAEYLALIKGLQKAVAHGYDFVDCWLDSQLVVRQCKDEWQIKDEKLGALKNQVTDLRQRFHKTSLNWIPRSLNSRADGLVNYALDNLHGTVIKSEEKDTFRAKDNS